MNTKINTLARFMISAFYIGNGISLMQYPEQVNLIPVSFGSTLFFAIGSLQLVSALFLFLGYKTKGAGIILIASTVLTAIFLQSSFLEVFKELAIAAGLMLLINNNSGEPFWEYVQTDIKDLPNYNVKL